MPRQNLLDKLVAEALAIEAEAAREAGAIGYMARALAQATMPHSRQEQLVFERTNGLFSMAMMAHPKVGLPYGSIPRLVLVWLTTEAVRRKERNIVLGDNLSGFMRQLDLVPTGGRWGTITRLRDQMQRLFASSVSCLYTGAEEAAGIKLDVASKWHLWWDTKRPEQAALWASTVTLGEEFFAEIVHHPIPIDLRALKALKRSPMALDIYCWLTYRMSYLKRRTLIPWGALQLQFGADYDNSKQGRYSFRKAFAKHLRAVGVIYPEAKIQPLADGLELRPSRSHIAHELPRVCG